MRSFVTFISQSFDEIPFLSWYLNEIYVFCPWFFDEIWVFPRFFDKVCVLFRASSTNFWVFQQFFDKIHVFPVILERNSRFCNPFKKFAFFKRSFGNFFLNIFFNSVFFSAIFRQNFSFFANPLSKFAFLLLFIYVICVFHTIFWQILRFSRDSWTKFPFFSILWQNWFFFRDSLTKSAFFPAIL